MSKSNREFQNEDYIRYLRICSELYPTDHRIECVIGERFFIKRFIKKLSLDLVIPLLNELSTNLYCSCQKKYDCQCRVGISKIISMLLDRYFELVQEPWAPEKIWEWTKNLYFQNGTTKNESLSVKILSENDELRQNIIRIAFGNIFDCKSIHETKFYIFERGHSGLNFQSQDYKYIVDLAFDTDNVKLWSYFMAGHNFYGHKGCNLLRKHMRMQALNKYEFLRIWYRKNIEDKNNYKRNVLTYENKRIARKDNKKQRNINYKNIQYIQENRQLIESGEHWDYLLDFSQILLQEPNKIVEKFGDEQLIRE